jgi:hypothetical protein
MTEKKNSGNYMSAQQFYLELNSKSLHTVAGKNYKNSPVIIPMITVQLLCLVHTMHVKMFSEDVCNTFCN